MPGAVWESCPPNILEWVRKQHMFWVSTAPLSIDGHVNVSPKSIKDTFHVDDDGKSCWYEDMTGSGCETICHLRENQRITLLFSAFEGPPRTCRFFGKGTVHEYGTPEYERHIPGDTRQPGSRSVIRIDIHKVLLSCGYTVPRYEFVAYRDQLKKFLAVREKPDADADKTIQAWWTTYNLQSMDGLPGLQTAQHTSGPMRSEWGNNWIKENHPQAMGIKSGQGEANKTKPPAKSNGKPAQLTQAVKSLDAGLVSSLLLDHSDQRILLGIVLGVVLTTVMNRVGVPII